MKFSEIIGQKICVDKLRNHVREGRISHAQLFAGQEGSGNLALALAYATYINCTNRTVDDSCGTCPSCHKFSRLIHPDMHFVFPVAPKKNADKTVSDDYVNVFREMVIEQPYSEFQEWIQAMDIDY
jgi:DNA polymerase-3 subunit delta'